MKARLATLDPAEAKRNVDAVTKDDGKRKRPPVKGVKHSDIPTQFLDSASAGGNRDTLGFGEGKREQAPE